MAVVDPIEIVVAHGDRATLRLGDAFLKIDADHTRADVEVEEWPSRRSRPPSPVAATLDELLAVDRMHKGEP